MSSYSLVYTTVKDDTEARALARGLVEARLAACVHVFPKGFAVYEWDGKVQEENEHMVVVKTRRDIVEDVMAHIRNNHSYDVPALFAVTLSGGDDEYLGWISRQTSGL